MALLLVTYSEAGNSEVSSPSSLLGETLRHVVDAIGHCFFGMCCLCASGDFFVTFDVIAHVRKTSVLTLTTIVMVCNL